MPLCDKLGVTRVGDVTGLDRTGIPNFIAVRPREAEPGISYHNGKGLTTSAAKAGALMEALERHSGERCDLPVICGRWEDVLEHGAAVDPRKIITPLVREYETGTRLEWVEGHDLVNERPTLVPLNAVVRPYTPTGGAVEIYRSHTNGLASGNMVTEAICHGMCEVVERDALSIADAIDVLAPAIAHLYHCDGTEPAGARKEIPGTLGRRVDLHTLPPIAGELVTKMERAGLRVCLRDVSAAIGVAAFECTCTEEGPHGRHVVHGGSGSHPDARVAVNRALTEAAQSRVAHIQGGREDLVDILRQTVSFDSDQLAERGESCSFSTVPTVENSNIDDDIRHLLDRLSDAHLDQVVVVDLTQQELGVPVVRVVIPEAETWSAFSHHGDPARLGHRANQALSDAVSGLLGSETRPRPAPSSQSFRDRAG